MPRSILTEKLSRRGYHPSREYGVDPLEAVSVAEGMIQTHLANVALTGSNHRRGPMPKIFAHTDETLRSVAEEMWTTGVASMPVFDPETGRARGTINVEQ
jgi:CBS domain-containing protein